MPSEGRGDLRDGRLDQPSSLQAGPGFLPGEDLLIDPDPVQPVFVYGEEQRILAAGAVVQGARRDLGTLADGGDGECLVPVWGSGM